MRFANQRFHYRLCALLLTLATVGGCDTPARPLRVAVNPWPGYAFLYLAEEAGYFEQEGVPLQLVELTSLGDVRRAFETGRADVMACSAIELLLVHHAATCAPQAFLVADYSNGADVLLARPELKSMSDLRGCRVGFEPSTLDAVHLFAALRSAGLSLSDVQLIPLPDAEKTDAFLRNELDAVQCYPPVSTSLMAGRQLNTLYDSSHIPQAVVDVLVANESTIRSQPDLLEGLVRAYGRAQQLYLDQPEHAMEIMCRRTGMPRAEFQSAMQGIRILDRHQQLPELTAPEGLQHSLNWTANVMSAAKMFSKPLATDGLISATIAARARGK